MRETASTFPEPECPCRALCQNHPGIVLGTNDCVRRGLRAEGRPRALWCTTTALHYAHLAMSLINLGALGCVLLMRGLAYVHELAQPAALRFRFPARDDSEPKGRRAVDARLQSPLVRWLDGA